MDTRTALRLSRNTTLRRGALLRRTHMETAIASPLRAFITDAIRIFGFQKMPFVHRADRLASERRHCRTFRTSKCIGEPFEAEPCRMPTCNKKIHRVDHRHGRMTARRIVARIRNSQGGLMMFHRFLLILALLIPADRALALDCGGATQSCIVADGEYHIAIPDGWQGGPAVMHLHGYGGSGAKAIGRKDFVERFTSRGYALIAPNALPWDEGKPRDWAVRDGWLIYPRRDVLFLRAVLADAVMHFDVDPNRLLLTGFSRGGSMVWDMACHAPDFARAYAPAAGGFWLPMPENCTGPASILHVHGFADATVPLEGRSIHSEEYEITIRQADIWEGLQLWRRENSCPSNPAEHEISDGIWRKRWKCEDGSLALALHKGKHGLPPGWTSMVLDWFESLDN